MRMRIALFVEADVAGFVLCTDDRQQTLLRARLVRRRGMLACAADSGAALSGTLLAAQGTELMRCTMNFIELLC